MKNYYFLRYVQAGTSYSSVKHLGLLRKIREVAGADAETDTFRYGLLCV